jgi:DNA-directed RNA polymerase specialized sigma24 family protein
MTFVVAYAVPANARLSSRPSRRVRQPDKEKVIKRAEQRALIHPHAVPQGAKMKDWQPSPEAWNKFLTLLDADAERAGEKYWNIQKKLITFFECRRCMEAERLADVSLNRVIRRYFEGENFKSLMGYVYGVAKIVFLESLAEQRQRQAVQDHLTRAGEPTSEPAGADGDDDLQVCFDACMAELQSGDRKFIKEYYEELRRKKIDKRKSMAEELGISPNAVALRAFHIRERLKKCIKKRLSKRQR